MQVSANSDFVAASKAAGLTGCAFGAGAAAAAGPAAVVVAGRRGAAGGADFGAEDCGAVDFGVTVLAGACPADLMFTASMSTDAAVPTMTVLSVRRIRFPCPAIGRAAPERRAWEARVPPVFV